MDKTESITYEHELVEQCKNQNSQAFNQLYDLYIEKIYNFVFFRVHHKESAEDLTSKTFIKAWENINRFDSAKGNFSTWIYAIARNNVVDHYRKEKVSIDIDEIINLSSMENIEKETAARIQLDQVKEFLKGLPEEQREIVIMRVWEDLSYKEIAEILGKSEASCKMSFHRTMQKVQANFPVAALLLLMIKGF